MHSHDFWVYTRRDGSCQWISGSRFRVWAALEFFLHTCRRQSKNCFSKNEGEMNFLFILSFTFISQQVAARFAFLVVPVATSLPAALAILAAWEAVLQQTSHLETLPSSSSLHGLFGLLLNFLLANKSGISSCLGFLCIYLMAAWIGQIVFTKRKSIFDCFEVAFLTALLGAVAVASVLFLPPASRRWANASYSIASVLNRELEWRCVY